MIAWRYQIRSRMSTNGHVCIVIFLCNAFPASHHLMPSSTPFIFLSIKIGQNLNYKTFQTWAIFALSPFPTKIWKSRITRDFDDLSYISLNLYIQESYLCLGRVELYREAGKSLGISIVGGRGMGSRLSNGEVMRGIFIKHILKDSPAGQNGTLKTGDMIVQVGKQARTQTHLIWKMFTNCVTCQVDGVDLRDASHEQAVDAIRKAGNPVIFVVQSIVSRPRVGKHTCAHTQPYTYLIHVNLSFYNSKGIVGR